MSGGGSGSSYFPSPSDNLHRMVEQSREEAEQRRLEGDVNTLLRQLLVSMKQDIERVQDCLTELESILGDKAEIDRLLFGGSVAKHTYVDGLSDVDALVVLDREDLAGKSPDEVLRIFHKTLRDCLTSDKVASVEKGRMAVTVRYHDGLEIQLLPALREGATVSIPSADAKSWKETRPKQFQRALSSANDRLNSALVPTIKLMKSIVSGLPEGSRLTGYHVESLCMEAVKGYRGTKTVKVLLQHVLSESAERVLSPIADVTGQSRVVDEYLGKANSTQRRAVARALGSVVRGLNAATSADQGKDIIDG